MEYGIPPNNLYTGPGQWSATLTSSMSGSFSPTQTSSKPIPNSGPKASVIGPAVGVPVGVLLIAAIVGGWLLMRHRKKKRAAASAAATDHHPEMGAAPSDSRYSQAPSHFSGSQQPEGHKQPDYYTTGGWNNSSTPHSPPQHPAHGYYGAPAPSEGAYSSAPAQQSMWTGSSHPSHVESSQAGAGGRASTVEHDTAMSPTISGLHELPDANAFSAAQNLHPGTHELGTDSR